MNRDSMGTGRRKMLVAPAVLALILALGACTSSSGGGGGKSGSSSSTSTTRTYGGAGSAITISFTSSSSTGGTFAFSSRPALASTSTDQSVSGDYVVYDTGFLGLTPTASTGITPDPVGQTFAALELPNVVVFAAPFDDAGEGNITVLIPTGACPTGDLALNWVKSRPPSGWTADDDTYGTFTYTAATADANAVTKYSLGLDGTTTPVDSGGADLGPGTCADGTFHIATGTNGVDLFLNSAGGALAHDLDQDSIIYASPQDTSVTAANVGGDYSGVAFSISGTKTPFVMSLTNQSSTTTGTGQAISDITDLNSTTGSPVAVSFDSTGPSPIQNVGFASGTLDFTNGSGGVAGTTIQYITCAFQLDAGGTGRNVASCASENSNPEFFSIFMVSH